MPSTAITPITKTRLGELESAVRSGLASFITVGRALVDIREGKGYRLRGFDTFEDYCAETFHFSVRQGQRLIAAAETAEAVRKVTGKSPANESVARVLAPVASDPVVIERVNARLEKKHLTMATAPAETVAEVLSAVTGKSTLARPNGKPAAEKPHPGIKLTVLTNDVCPHCSKTPDTYCRNGRKWHCQLCHGEVRLSVAPPISQACPHCKAAIVPGVEFCGNCGGAI
jgi:hypothetical protein